MRAGTLHLRVFSPHLLFTIRYSDDLKTPEVKSREDLFEKADLDYIL